MDTEMDETDEELRPIHNKQSYKTKEGKTLDFLLLTGICVGAVMSIFLLAKNLRASEKIEVLEKELREMEKKIYVYKEWKTEMRREALQEELEKPENDLLRLFIFNRDDEDEPR